MQITQWPFDSQNFSYRWHAFTMGRFWEYVKFFWIKPTKYCKLVIFFVTIFCKRNTASILWGEVSKKELKFQQTGFIKDMAFLPKLLIISSDKMGFWGTFFYTFPFSVFWPLCYQAVICLVLLALLSCWNIRKQTTDWLLLLLVLQISVAIMIAPPLSR